MSLQLRLTALAQSIGADIKSLRTDLTSYRNRVINVKDFGALGDGSNNDTAAIQAAINSVPTQGGVVYFPQGTYKITSALTLVNSLTIRGDGSAASLIYQTSTSQHGLSGNNILFFQMENIRVVGPSTGTGTGIKLTRTTNANTNNVVMRNVMVRTFGADGIWISNAIVSSFNNVQVENCLGNGFVFVGESAIVGTSCSFTSCFANQNSGSGFKMDTMAYSSFLGCASEKNLIDYEVKNCIGVTFNGCGSEANNGTSWVFDGGYGNGIDGAWIYQNKGVGVKVKNNSIGVTLVNLSDTSPLGSATYFVDVDAGSKVVMINIHNTTPVRLAAGSTNVLSDSALDVSITGNTTVLGQLTIGPDTNLYRVSANVLATDDAFTAGGTLKTYANVVANNVNVVMEKVDTVPPAGTPAGTVVFKKRV